MSRSIANHPQFSQRTVCVCSGTTKIKHLKENVVAYDIILTKDEIAEIRKAVEDVEAPGPKYSEGFTEETFRDTPTL